MPFAVWNEEHSFRYNLQSLHRVFWHNFIPPSFFFWSVKNSAEVICLNKLGGCLYALMNFTSLKTSCSRGLVDLVKRSLVVSRMFLLSRLE